MPAAKPFERLKRAIAPFPLSIKRALVERELMTAYRSRPGYQQNDYLTWIDRAKRQATKDKRLAQMLDELARGDVYMNMRWSPGPSTQPAARTKKVASAPKRASKAGTGRKKSARKRPARS